MAQLASNESLNIELEEIGRSIRSSFSLPRSISHRSSGIGSTRDDDGDDEYELQWAAIERLSTFRRTRMSVLDHCKDGSTGEGQNGRKVVDVTKLGALERRLLVEKLIKHTENDNRRLLNDKFKSLSDPVLMKRTASIVEFATHSEVQSNMPAWVDLPARVGPSRVLS